MSTSERTINQVRNILGRLDRSIDEARDRRLRGDEPEPEREQFRIDPEPQADAAEDAPDRTRAPSQAPPPPVGPNRASNRAPSPFGRAKPLRRTATDS